MKRNPTSSLLISEPPLQVLPSLAVAVGLNEAIFLQQVHYWLGRSTNERDGRVWVYNSIPEWQEQLPFWSESTIKRLIADLRKRKLLITSNAYNKTRFDQTLWYTIDYARLDSTISSRPSGQVDPMEEVILTLSTGSERTDPSGQNDLLLYREYTETNLAETTQESTRDERMNEPARAKAPDYSFIRSSLTPEQWIEFNDCYALLRDPEVGLDEPTACDLAQKHDFEYLERQVFAWIANRDKTGNFGSTGALVKRIISQFSAPPLTLSQRRTDLYGRFHFTYVGLGESDRRHYSFPDDEEPIGDPD